MHVSQIMTTQVVSVDADASIGVALQLLHSGNFRRLPVLQDGRLVGIITDRDLRLATNSPLVLSEKWYSDFILESIKVKSCMTSDPITISPDANLLEATRLMRTRKFGGLPVVAGDRLVGMITVTDLLDYLIQLLEEKEAIG